MADEVDLKSTVEAYLAAFQARDADRCLAHFADQATIDFQMGTFRGRDAISEWHAARWSANLQVLKIESLSIRGTRAVVDLVVASDRLRAWKLQSLSARVTLTFEGGLVVTAKFAPRIMSPVEMIRSGGSS